MLHASPGLLGLALEEVLELEGVTHSGDDEVAHLMQAGGGAVTMATEQNRKTMIDGTLSSTKTSK